MTVQPAIDYSLKPASYFEGCRLDFVQALPRDPEAKILEIGCAGGSTGEAALQQRKCGSYIGVEINPEVAEIARGRLTEVITANVEEIDLPFSNDSFDALILSEVLEHLIDPWTTVEKLAKLVKPGGIVLASSPNISHYTVIGRLLKGQWHLTDRGVMDRTHLRWFTPQTFKTLFEGADFEVYRVEPVVPLAFRTRLIDRLTGSRFRHLFMRQICIHGKKTRPKGRVAARED